MTVYLKELKQDMKAWGIWTVAITFMLVLCVLIFPEMKNEMDDVSNLFSNMGGFSAAFGMDQVSFGEIMGFYGIECGNVLGIGGSFFAALLGISVLAKEEKERTAEFLYTHPVSRSSILTQKLFAVLTEIVAMNVVIAVAAVLSFLAVGEEVTVREFVLLHIAYLILQIEISGICFGISAFIRRGSIGIGLGIALAFYFMNIVANISESAEFLRYITPFAYTEASDIISKSELDMKLIGIGALLFAVGVCVGFVHYTKKDIAA